MVRAILEAGLQIHWDLSVVGYDDIAFVGYMHPSLTTIWQPTYAFGAESAWLILKRLNHPAGAPQPNTLAPRNIHWHPTIKPATYELRSGRHVNLRTPVPIHFSAPVGAPHVLKG